MYEYKLHFSGENCNGTEQYCLMELPHELVTIIQDNTNEQLSIRGQVNDDAVFCTAEKTYAIRSITLSNTFCILSPPREGECGDLLIRDNAQQMLEITPSMPKLYRLTSLLKGNELHDNEECEGARGLNEKSLQDVKSEIQASDREFEMGLKEKHILTLNGELRPISPPYLNTILELLLNTLVLLNASTDASPASDIADALQYDHEVPREVSLQVMSWFGQLTQTADCASQPLLWRVDVDNVVRQLGIGVLSTYRSISIEESDLLRKWKTIVGDAWQDKAQLSLLTGNYVCSGQSPNLISYFPSSELPTNPSDRFSDLFRTKSQWKAVDLMPFLAEIAINSKERDKLLMKFTRATTDKDGQIWYSSRSGIVA